VTGCRNNRPRLAHFHKLLKNPYYKGVIRYRGEQYPDRHEPLVPVKTWARVQELLPQKSNSGENVRKHDHYLKSTVWCGTCSLGIGVDFRPRHIVHSG